MEATVIFHFLVLHFLFVQSGYGESICKWSNRVIPKDATGNFNITVPLYYSYSSGYINEEPFGTYRWAKGWCTHKKDYFRCPYGEHNDLDTTDLLLPKIEDISYLMLKDSYPITLHKAEDTTVPGFYVPAGRSLDVCPEYNTVNLRWTFNGKEKDVQDVSCYVDGRELCSGAEPIRMRPLGSANNTKCGYYDENGRIGLGYKVRNPKKRFRFYYCYLDKAMTKAQTFIVDWKDGNKTRETKEVTLKVSATTTSGAQIIFGKMWTVWLWMILAKQL